MERQADNHMVKVSCREVCGHLSSVLVYWLRVMHCHMAVYKNS